MCSCGQLRAEVEGDPELVAIPVGALGDPLFPKPTVSVWESRRHQWVTLPADTRRHE
jgi:hypothetical protein